MNLVMIIPAALLEQANLLGAALGHGPCSYSIALSPNGGGPATHYGLNLVQPDLSLLEILAGAAEGNMPAALEFPADQFALVMAELISDEGEFNIVATAHGLQIVEEAE